MIIKRAACLAFTAACLTGIATLPAAHAQTAYGTAPGTYGAAPGTYNYGALPPPPSYGTAAGTYAPQAYQGYASPPPPATGTTEVVTNGPQGATPPNWSPQRNVIESEHYDRLLETNPRFREARIRKECDPITDPQLHQQCVESFAQYEPSTGATGYGASSTTRHYRSNSGR
jgi:hypothetical protein